MIARKRIYIKIAEILETEPKTHKELISAYMNSLKLPREVMLDRSTSGKANVERSIVGSAISEMRERGFITKDSDGKYRVADQKPVIIRYERCENEILKMLDGRSMSKNAIRKELMQIFGTDKTLTEKDDNKLFAYMGETLKRLVKNGTLTFIDKYYSVAAKAAARIDDISATLLLRSSYLTRVHRKGGEFFEFYFMTLLEKYLTLFGKTVISNTTTGGSVDGGIDGIIETVDCLGFKETIMVQTKNRSDPTNETTVRGFYGAVCARMGSRGIFVTSSDFHPAAKEFIDSIDNCVGVDGEKLFEMARATHYGLKKVGAEYVVDDKIL